MVAIGTLQLASASDVLDTALAEGVSAVEPERQVGCFVEAKHADGTAEVLSHLYRTWERGYSLRLYNVVKDFGICRVRK